MNAMLKPNVNHDVLTVTPDIAEKWLESNLSNRPVKKSHVQKMAAAMQRGEWMLNGETIKFDVTGRLVDGQHRLFAVVQAGVGVQFEVRYNVPAAAFMTIDNGIARGHGDVLHIMGFQTRSRDVAAAARIVICGQRGSVASAFSGGMAGRAISSAMVVSALEANPDLNGFVVNLHERGLAKVCPLGIAGGILYLIHKKHPSDPRVAPFIEGLITGENLVAKTPIYVLRERFLSGGTKILGGLRRAHAAAFLIKAWNAHLADAPMSLLRYAHKRGESFPEIA